LLSEQPEGLDGVRFARPAPFHIRADKVRMVFNRQAGQFMARIEFRNDSVLVRRNGRHDKQNLVKSQ